jgi:hypothetical protein
LPPAVDEPSRRRGRGIFGCRQDLHRGFYRLIELVLLLGRLLEERGGGLRPTHGKRAWDDVVEAQLRLGEPRDASGERARHVAADRPKVERVQITFRAFPDHHHVVAHARSLESVPNRGGQPVVEALAPFLKLSGHGVHLHRRTSSRVQNGRAKKNRRFKKLILW